MAFDYTNLYPDTSANGGYTKSWNYTTLDTIATVSASGYFNKVATRVGIGDNIFVSVVDAFDKTRTTLVDFATLYVNSISGGVVTTVSDKAHIFIDAALTGTPTAPTATPGTNSTQIATTAYADAIAALKANIASPTFTGTPAAPTAAPGTNTTQIATTAFTVAEILARVASLDVAVYKGVIDCSANPNYPAADAGNTYRVSVAGKIGGASGTNVEVGDMMMCLTDGTASGTQAAVGANWDIIQTNIDGAVVGPASAVSANFASFNGTSGKLLQDSGKALPSGAVVGTTDSQTLTNKTISGANNTITLTTATNALAANVNLNNTGTYFDGPSCAQGTSGTWFVSGSVVVGSTAGAATFYAKLWDGTTAIAAGTGVTTGANNTITFALCGIVTNPAANMKISVRGPTDTSGLIVATSDGVTKAANLTAIRIG